MQCGFNRFAAQRFKVLALPAVATSGLLHPGSTGPIPGKAVAPKLFDVALDFGCPDLFLAQALSLFRRALVGGLDLGVRAAGW